MTTNEKIAQLRAAMLAAGADAYFIPTGDPHASEYLPRHYCAREYFSGFTGENSVMVVTSTKSALWADGRFFVQAAKQLQGSEIELMRMGEPEVPTVEEYCARELGAGQVLGLCGLTASTKEVQELQKALEPKGAQIKCLYLEDELWTEGRAAKPTTPAWLISREYAGAAPAEKIALLRDELKSKGCTAQLVAKLDNVAWLLNLRAMDIDCTPYAMAYCYVTMKKAVLFINSVRLTPEAAAELDENGIEICPYDSILDFLAAQTEPQTVLADAASVNFAITSTLEHNSAFTVKNLTDPTILMKGIKNPTELAHMREAHIRDGVAMVRFEMELEHRLGAGETLYETDIDEMLHRHRSAQDKFLVESFETIAAYGPNAAMMHYHATMDNQSIIEPRGFLLVDSGGTYLDGTTDITRTYPVGPLTQEEKELYTWVLQSHIDMAKAVWLDYCTGQMLDILAREPLWRHLINYRCGTGHSVSFVGNVHEGPQSLSPRGVEKFVPGMTITDEPGVYETDKLGIRIENELECVERAINQYGRFLAFEPQTCAPIDTTAVLPEVFEKDQLAWLNSYHAFVYEKLSPRLTGKEQAWLAKKCAPIS